MKNLLSVVFTIVGVIAVPVGFLFLSQATMGVGILAIAACSLMLVRIINAEINHEAQMKQIQTITQNVYLLAQQAQRDETGK